MLRSPTLLILDEPIAGLDPEGVRVLHDLLASFSGSGGTVLLSGHDMGEVDLLCGDVTILSAGRRVYDGGLRATGPGSRSVLAAANRGRRGDADPAQVEGIDAAPGDAAGLLLHATVDRLDSITASLGRAGIGIRELSRVDSALEAMFLQLVQADAAKPGSAPR